jgi:hypothetical protein
MPRIGTALRQPQEIPWVVYRLWIALCGGSAGDL